MSPPRKSKVTSQDYTKDYYVTDCEGYKEFNESAGNRLSSRLSYPIELAELKPDFKILDVGSGRGEIIYQTAQLNLLSWGIDYSRDALLIAKDNLNKNFSSHNNSKYLIQQADAQNLPFQNHVMDRVFMLDVVEHLLPDELENALIEVKRVLKPDGKLIIHTMPSLWYYQFGYPLYRLLQFLRGVILPKNPRDRFEFSHLHVNEQSPLSLYKILNKVGFNSKVWLNSTSMYEYEKNILVRKIMSFSVRFIPFKIIFCNDIFAIASKKLDR